LTERSEGSVKKFTTTLQTFGTVLIPAPFERKGIFLSEKEKMAPRRTIFSIESHFSVCYPVTLGIAVYRWVVFFPS
jgi:hypothetical protein